MESCIRISMRVPIVLTQKERWVVAACPALDVLSQGKDEAEARSNLIEAVGAFLESCLERGTLNQVLMDCGFVPGKADSVETEQETIDVPLYLPAKFKEGSQCHHA